MKKMKDLRDKIAEILRNYATQYGTWTNTYDYVDQILAIPEILNGLILLSEKLGDTVEWGKEEGW